LETLAVHWRVVDFELAEGDVVLSTFKRDGNALEIVADVELHARNAILAHLHIRGAGPNTLGSRALRALVRDVMDWLDVDELRIEGATRTCGAGPGHDPRPLVFRRA
jgi:hypothetical protein